MLSQIEKEFVIEKARTDGKFGMISHAISLARILNGFLEAQGRTVTPGYVYNEMVVADVDVNECIRENL